MTQLLPALAAAVVAVLLVPASMRLAPRLGLVRAPRADRWGDRAVPTFGGLGMTGGIVAGLGMGAASGALAPMQAVTVGAGMVALFALGLADDRGHVSPGRRLGVEAIIGGAMAWSIFVDQPLAVQLAATVLSLVAVPLAVNATNLIDNADGLAASLSAVTAGVLAAGPIVLAAPGGSVVPLAILGATSGFLVYNAPPARTFMGDSGSLPLGGALAAASLMLVDAATGVTPGAWSAAGAVAAGCIVVLAWTAQGADVTLVVVSRLRGGRSPFQGGTDHTSHRLLRSGLDAQSTLLTITALGALAGAVGLVAGWIALEAPAVGLALTATVVLVALGLEAWLARRQPKTDGTGAATQPAPPSATRAGSADRAATGGSEPRETGTAVRVPRP